MKSIAYYLYLVCFLVACSTQKTPNTGPNDSLQAIPKDSGESHEIEYEAQQKNYMNLLIGNWTVDTMRRQAGMDSERLINVYLTFNRDSGFTGNGGCNHIGGKYALKGTGIKFSNISATKMACDRLEQETAFLNLLQNRVSAYAVNKDSLWLRDGSGNSVFFCQRKGG